MDKNSFRGQKLRRASTLFSKLSESVLRQCHAD